MSTGRVEHQQQEFRDYCSSFFIRNVAVRASRGRCVVVFKKQDFSTTIVTKTFSCCLRLALRRFLKNMSHVADPK